MFQSAEGRQEPVLCRGVGILSGLPRLAVIFEEISHDFH